MKTEKCTRPVMALAMYALLASCGYYPSVDARTERAAASLAAGDYAAAESELAVVLKREPTHGKALLGMTKVELKLGRADAARSYLARAQQARADAATIESLNTEVLLAEGKFAEILKLVDSRTTSADTKSLALRAAAHLGLRDNAAAEADLDAALRSSPDDAEVLLRLAQLRLAQGRGADAVAVLDKAVVAKPWLAQVWLLRGTTEMTLGHADAARAAFQSVADAQPAQVSLPEKMQGLAGLAEIYLGKNALVSAAETVKKLRALAPGSTLVHYLQGRLALQSGDAPKAVAELTVVTRAAPNDAASATLLGAAQLAQGSREQAQATLSRVVANFPDNVYARKLLAQVQLASNQADAARQTLAAGGQSAPADAQSDYLMASSLMKLGDVAGAISYLEKSVTAAPQNVGVRQQLARAYLMVGAFAKARATLELVPVAKRDKNAQSLLVLARIAGQNGPEAMHTLEQLVAANPGDGELIAIAGTYALKLGDITVAGRYFTEAKRLIPDNITARLGLADVAAAKSDFSAAKDNLLAVLRADPTQQSALLGLASLEQRQGHMQGARSWLEKAISADPSTTTARLALAQLEFKDGNLPKAKNLLDQAIAVAPDKAAVTRTAGEVAFAAGQPDEAAARFIAAMQLGGKSSSLDLAKVQIAMNKTVEARKTLAAIDEPGLALRAGVMLVELDARDGKFDMARKRAVELQKNGLAAAGASELEGDVNVAAKQLDAALASYHKSYEITPSRGVAVKLFRIAQSIQTKEPEKALQRWLEKHPNDAEIRLMFASRLQQAGRRTEAIAEYEKLLRGMAAPNAFVLNNLAWAYYESGDKRALETARKAYVGNESRPEIADTYGWLLVESGDVISGRRILEAAVGGARGNLSMRYHLATAKNRSNEKVAAISELRELLAVGTYFPEKAAAEQLLSKLSAH